MRAVSLPEDLLGQRPFGKLDGAADVNLAAQYRPVKQQCDVWVVAQVPGLAGPQRGGEDDSRRLDAAGRNDPARRSARGSRGRKRGGVVLGQSGGARLGDPIGKRAQRRRFVRDDGQYSFITTRLCKSCTRAQRPDRPRRGFTSCYQDVAGPAG